MSRGKETSRTAQEIFAEGRQHHQAGRLAEAERLYRQALDIDPSHADSLHLLGVAAIQTGRPELAVDMIRKAIAINATVSAYHSNLGNVLAAQGRPDEAAASYRDAIRLDPGLPEPHNNLANMLRQTGHLDEAVACYRKAVQRNPHFLEAHGNLASVLLEQGNLEGAVTCYRTVLSLKQDCSFTHYQLGNALKQLGRLDEAAASFASAIGLRPDFSGAHNNLGNALRQLGRTDEAFACYSRALELAPGLPATCTNLGVALHDLGRLEDPAASYRRALDIDPSYSDAHNNLGALLQEQGQLPEAIACFSRSSAIQPDFPEAHNNLGAALRESGRLADAAASYRKAIQLKADFPDAHHNLALVLLAQGNMTEGWEEYEWRWETPQMAKARRNFTQPQWRGEAAEGKTLLVHAEQGFGDTIQFCRYASIAAARGLRVILEVQQPLLRLLRGLPGTDMVVARGARLPPFDLHCPMLSMPKALGTVIGTIPACQSYLQADGIECATWQGRLDALASKKFKIGLVWAGSAKQPTDRRRSLAPERLTAVLDVPGLHFFSLQKDGPAAASNLRLSNFMDGVEDFAATAALIANLDLVISVDTAVAHLAAALGKPVWLLDRFDPDWRWLSGRRDSPWYPSLRIYRQPHPGDWDAVIAEVVQDLGILVTAEPGPWTPAVHAKTIMGH